MVPNRKALLGILYVLLNGRPWDALPKEYIYLLHAEEGIGNIKAFGRRFRKYA
jgi:hypothetical protein